MAEKHPQMFNILSLQRNANQNNPKVLPHTSQWIRSKTQVTADIGKDVEKEEHSIIASGISSLYIYFGNQSGRSSENWK